MCLSAYLTPVVTNSALIQYANVQFLKLLAEDDEESRKLAEDEASLAKAVDAAVKSAKEKQQGRNETSEVESFLRITHVRGIS